MVYNKLVHFRTQGSFCGDFSLASARSCRLERWELLEKEYGKENETAVYERISRSILDFWGIKDENITSYSIL